MTKSWPRILVTMIGTAWMLPPVVLADVELRWLPQSRVVAVGKPFEVELYAVSDDGVDQTIAAIDVVLTWESDRIALVGVVDNGPYQWLESGFLPDFVDELNLSLLDGDAKYTALSRLGNPALATPDGLLVTTFVFFALTEVDLTKIIIEPALSPTATTRVFGGDRSVQNITGDLHNLTVKIVRRRKVMRSGPTATYHLEGRRSVVPWINHVPRRWPPFTQPPVSFAPRFAEPRRGE